MQNKEGIFSLPELSQLKEFCDNCAIEDRKIYEQRKNGTYIPEDKKPEPIKKQNVNTYQYNNNNYNYNNYNNNNNKYSQNYGNKKIQNVNYNNNYNNNNYNYNNYQQQSKCRMNPDTFERRLRMFES